MMRARIAPLLVTFALCSCGGGSGSGGAPVAPAKPAATKTQVGTASLVLKFPPNFQTASRRASTSSRRPAYINPSGSAVLAITVDETPIPGSPISLNLQNSDGTQTLNVPIFSNYNNNVVAIEYADSSETQILAIGEADNNSASYRTSTSITLQMQENVTGVAFSTQSNGSGAFVLSNAVTTPVNVGSYCGTVSPPSSNAFYLWTVDANGGFVAQAGYGGTSTPVLSGLAPGGPSYTSIANGGGSPQQGGYGYYVTYDPLGDSIYPTVTYTNPAEAIVTAVEGNTGQYPSLYNLATYDGLSLSSIAPQPTTTATILSISPNNGC